MLVSSFDRRNGLLAPGVFAVRCPFHDDDPPELIGIHLFNDGDDTFFFFKGKIYQEMYALSRVW